MGPSGCGKTTLLNCLSGLDELDSGEVHIEGADLRQMDDRRRTDYRCRRMGFIFQTFNLLPVLTAVENVELPLLVGGVRPAEARRRSVAALERVGLGERIHHRPAELSGGQRQRVSIARALVNGPAIVWADEPTGNLDSKTTADVMESHPAAQYRAAADFRDRHPRRRHRRVVQPHRAHERRRDHRPGPKAGAGGGHMNAPQGMPLNVTVALGLLIAVVAILLFLFLAGLRQPVMAKLGMRSIPRRPTQSILIVFGLTLSTVIIVSALAIGDTLNYLRPVACDQVVRRDRRDHRAAAAGYLCAVGRRRRGCAGQSGDRPAGRTRLRAQPRLRSRNWRRRMPDWPTCCNSSTRACRASTTARYEQLRDRVQQEPLADGVAASIVFPTIIRNTTTGQGEPLGFVMAVDDEYTRGFGLHSVDGQAVTMERLRPGVGNIFVLAGRLFAWANQTGSQSGLGGLKPSDVATAIAGAGALLSGAGGAGQPDAVTGATAPSLGSAAPITGTAPSQACRRRTLSLANLNLSTFTGEIDRVLGEAGCSCERVRCI